MRRALFLYQDDNLPSTRIRVHNLLPELNRLGLACEAMQMPAGLWGRIGVLNKVRQFDVVVLQKKLLSMPEARALRAASRRLVFDFDDAIYIRDDTHQSHRSLMRALKFRAVASAAHTIIAGNAVLAAEARRFCKDVRVLPSAVQTTGLPVKDHTLAAGPVVLGWVGSKGNLHHLRMLEGVLGVLGGLGKKGVVLHVVSNAQVQMEGIEVVNIPWSLEGQDREVARFDVGLMPLPDNPWTRGKCGYKALQYMAAGVPPVCSDVGGNRALVSDGVEGCLARDAEGFREALERLMGSAKLRADMGQRARQRAVREYSIEAVARGLAAVLSG